MRLLLLIASIFMAGFVCYHFDNAQHLPLGFAVPFCAVIGAAIALGFIKLGDYLEGDY